MIKEQAHTVCEKRNVYEKQLGEKTEFYAVLMFVTKTRKGEEIKFNACTIIKKTQTKHTKKREKTQRNKEPKTNL